MSVLIPRTTGDWLNSATWGLVDSTSLLRSESGSSVPPTSAGATARSAAATTGAITIDGIAVFMQARNGTTGTMTVRLWNNTDSALVTGATCTINCSDLPAGLTGGIDGGWVMFAFASVTLLAAKSYMVEVITSTGAQVTLYTNGVANNWSRALRTTTTQAPVAGDDIIGCGDHTGAGAGNDFTVTVDETGTTDYGSNTTSTVTPAIAVCKGFTLKWKDSSAANPKLRVSGHVIVYRDGTLNMGTTGTPIPRGSTAVLEFDCAADGDFGLVCRAGSNYNSQGLSRTSGKDVVSCKLIADVAASGTAPSTSTLTVDTDTGWLSGDYFALAATSRTTTDCEAGTLNANAGSGSIVVKDMTVASAGMAVPPTSNRGCLAAHSGTGVVGKTATMVVGSPGTVVVDNHGMRNDAAVYFTTTGGLLTGLTANTVCYVVNRTNTGFQVAATPGGSPITFSGTQSGIHTANLHMTQAELILLTRNVKVRSVSATAMSFVQIHDGGNVDVDWTEFYNLGANALGKRGIELAVNLSGSLAFNVSIKYSSIHNVESNGFYTNVTSQTITLLEFCYNTMWNFAAFNIAQAITASNYTIDHNILMRNTNGSSMMSLADSGGTYTNNLVIAATSSGYAIDDVALGTWDNNSAHCCGANGVIFSTNGNRGDLGFVYTWRNNSAGILFNTVTYDLSLTVTAFGNANNVRFEAMSADVTVNYPVLGGDTTFSTTNGILLNAGNTAYKMTINGGDFSSVAGILAAHTNDINTANTINSYLDIVARNTKLGASTQISHLTLMTAGSKIAVERIGQVSGVRKTWLRYGIISADSVVFNTAAPSVLMAPNSATNKLESSPRGDGPKCEVATGTSVTASVYIRKTATYNGNQPRLGVRANPAVGILVDTILATYSAGTAAWNQISGATITVTDGGVLEFYVDCDGTAGAINWDDMAAS